MPAYASCDALTTLAAQVAALASSAGADGSETKILPKDASVTVTGTGTTADPYKIGAVASGTGGSAATSTVAGVVQLNDGTATGDATDCSAALTACGLSTLLNSTAQPANALQTAVAQAAAKTVSVKDLGTITLSPTTANDIILTSDTSPAGWNVGAGRMSFSANVQFNSYFANNPGGHMAIVLRQDPATGIPGGAVRGQGVAVGNLLTAPEGTQTNPGIQAEAWANGTSQNNRLIPSTAAPTKILDNTLYSILVESSVGHDGRKYVRYALYRYVVTGVNIIFDSGDVLDTLAGVDMTKSALLIGHVFGAGGTGWNITFTNAKVTWGPFGEKNTDFSGVTTVLAASVGASAPSSIGFAIRTSPFVQPSTATRTWATVPLDFNATNPSYGSWNAAKTEFTFSVAGTYVINVTGPIGTFYSASAAGGQVSTDAYLDLGTYQQWVGGSAGAVVAGSDLIDSSSGGGSVPVVATVGQVIKLVLTTVSTGVTTAAGVFGVAGGVQGGGNAASGMSITPI
jgi:hypothetical protein